MRGGGWMKLTWRRHQWLLALACPSSLKVTTWKHALGCLLPYFMFGWSYRKVQNHMNFVFMLWSLFVIKFFTWKDECDEAGGDGHGSKDEGGDDGADLGQGGHCR